MAATTRLLVTVAVAGALVLAGCGGDGSSDSDESGSAQRKQQSEAPSNEGGSWSGQLADTYSTAKLVCGMATPERNAKDLGLPASADGFEIAEEYATGYVDEHRQPAFEGCLDGLGGGG